MSMNVSGVSLLPQNQTAYGSSESKSAQDGNSNSGGWKYMTVQDGDTVYTYVVIGKDMKVLIGKTSVKEDKDKDQDKDKKTAANQGNAADKPKEMKDTKKNSDNKQEVDKLDFLTDSRMFALTAFYQKKIRETLKNMEAQMGTAPGGQDKVLGLGAKEKAENQNESAI